MVVLRRDQVLDAVHHLFVLGQVQRYVSEGGGPCCYRGG